MPRQARRRRANHQTLVNSKLFAVVFQQALVTCGLVPAVHCRRGGGSIRAGHRPAPPCWLLRSFSAVHRSLPGSALIAMIPTLARPRIRTSLDYARTDAGRIGLAHDWDYLHTLRDHSAAHHAIPSLRLCRSKNKSISWTAHLRVALTSVFTRVGWLLYG